MQTLETESVRGVWVTERQILASYRDTQGNKLTMLHEGQVVCKNRRAYELFLHDYPRERFLVSYIGEA